MTERPELPFLEEPRGWTAAAFSGGTQPPIARDCARRYNAAEVFRAGLALVILSFGVARGAAPSYSAAGIVNASSFTPGPFAPNSILALFGSNLATDQYSITGADIQNNMLPTKLIGTQVFVGSSTGSGGPSHAAPLFFVSPTQINFILPANLCPSLPCSVVVRVSTNSNSGPEVTVNMTAAAPALFSYVNYPGFVIATHGDSASVVTPDSPAHGGDIIVLYATGLGKTQEDPVSGELTCCPSGLIDPNALQIVLGGVVIDSSTTCPTAKGVEGPCIEYAGLTATQAALYQINLIVPSGIGANPTIQVMVDGQASATGPQLAVQ